jgi:hypothetical protein
MIENLSSAANKNAELFHITGLNSNSVCCMASSLVIKSTLCNAKIYMAVSV